MAFFFLCVTIFIMFFQPVYVFSQLEHLQPLRNMAILALVAYFFSKRKNEVPFSSVDINRYFLLFALAQTISSFTIWSQAGIETLNLWLRLGIVFFLIFKSVVNINRLKRVILMILAGISYLSYYSISNLAVDALIGRRASGFGWFENPNDLSLILVSVIPLAILMANLSKKFLIKLFFLIIAGIFSYNILFSGSRGGLLGLMTVGFSSLFFAEKLPKLSRFVLVVLLIGAIAGIGITSVLNRSDHVTGLRGDDSAENRIVQWKAGMRMIADRPLFGVGRGEFESTVREYGGVGGLSPHNTIIQVFAETGIPAGIFFLLFSIFPLKTLWKKFKNTDQLGDSTISLIYRYLWISLLGFWICAFFGNRYQEYILFVIIALIAAVKGNIDERREFKTKIKVIK